MSVPNRLHNSTAPKKYVVDADQLNQNFDSLSDGTGLDDNIILQRHISDDTTDIFEFPSYVILGVETDYAALTEGTIFYKRNTDGSGGFRGVAKDEDGNLIYVLLG